MRLAHGLGDAIEDDRQQDNTQPTDGSQPHVESADTAQHHLPQATNRDHRGDDHHRQRKHQRLVDPGHDRRQRQRQLHLDQHLQRRSTVGPCRFDQVRPHLTNTERGQPH